MPSLSAMFKLFDGYSSTVDKITSKTDRATNKILGASSATDKFNSRLNATGASASNASSGIGKFISVAAVLAGTMKAIDSVDTYANTLARLGLITDSQKEQLDLQKQIYAAADRSRGSYKDMANSVGKLGMLAGDAFGSKQELVGFTELMQKSFRIGGSSPQEQ